MKDEALKMNSRPTTRQKLTSKWWMTGPCLKGTYSRFYKETMMDKTGWDLVQLAVMTPR
jgi:hypothetical protein